jgi:hypothetical protein
LNSTEKLEGKRSIGRPVLRWEYINMDLEEVGYEDADWLQLARIRISGGILWIR